MTEPPAARGPLTPGAPAPPRRRRRPFRLTIGALMLGVLMAAVGLAVFRDGRPAGPVDWRERVMVVHALAFAAVPAGSALLYAGCAVGATSDRRRAELTGLAVAFGCIGWAFTASSLGFWLIVLLIDPAK